ncbi:MAG: hypothetical protein KF695_11015 [Simplicispira sp.]|nr:hypothetical protein [Simplicispira sp.]
MRFRLLRRRLTISAPRVAVRSALPWPLRWLVLAVFLGFCAAVSLWAFEWGRSLAGLDAGSRAELVRLRGELERLRADSQQAQTIANTSGSLLLAERSALEQLKLQLRQLESENRALREDLGFFEKLIPSSSSDDVAIRSLQAEQQADATLRWQVLVMRPVKNASEYSGQLELVAAGTRDGKPWSQRFAGEAQAFKLRQHQRLEGIARLPPHAVVKTLTARILREGRVRASQTTEIHP